MPLGSEADRAATISPARDLAQDPGSGGSRAGSRVWLWFVLAQLLVAACCIAAFPVVEKRFLIAAGERADGTLSLAARGLESEFQRFENVPPMLARDPVLIDLLTKDLVQTDRDAVNRFLRDEARRIGAAELFLLDRGGIVLAASSHEGEGSFVGRDFSYRPYFIEGLAGRPGRFFGLGTTSGERGYFVASPVRGPDGIAGVIALKFSFAALEASWQPGEPEVAVSDALGVIIMSSREDWLFRTLTTLSDEALSTIRSTRQYPVERLTPLDAVSRRLTATLERTEIAGSGGSSDYLVGTFPLSVESWAIRLFVPSARARTYAILFMLAVAGACVLASLLGIIFWQRRKAVLDRLAMQAANEALLVRRVQERTEMLSRAVGRLEGEVAHRKQTEKELRETQQELVQSEKLAALGKTSASISHEFNQPLTALRNFAQNALTFMERGMDDSAKDAMTSVIETLKRLGRLSRQLQDFSRKPRESVGAIPLRRPINRALTLFEARLLEQGVDLSVGELDQDLRVRADEIQLEQVMVNLIGNALDALEGRPDPCISITATAGDGAVTLRVSDNGPGIAEEMRQKIFEPFHTSKSHGRGLGLGLAIARNAVHDFGGTLMAGVSEDGGAEFTIQLRLARLAPAREEEVHAP